MKILGIDPGSRLSGFGVVEVSGNKHNYIGSGCIKLQQQEFNLRLKELFDSITCIVREQQPQVLAIEKVFVHKNASSALKLGHARGAIIAAVMQKAVPVFEYTPRQIKQAVVGYGAAEKAQIQQMIKMLLGLNKPPQADAADALAVALCHAQQIQYHNKIKIEE